MIESSSIFANQFLVRRPGPMALAVRLVPGVSEAVMSVDGMRGRVTRAGRTMTFRAGALPRAGTYQATVEADGMSTSIPFHVIDTAAPVPAALRLHAFLRVRRAGLRVERLAPFARPRGAYVELFKGLDSRGRTVALAYDQRGKATPHREVWDQLEADRLRRFGRLHETVHARVARARASERIPVVIWVHLGDTTLVPGLSPTGRNPDRADRATVSHLRAVERATAAFMAARPAAMARSMERDARAPIVYARLTAAEIRALADDPSVARVFVDDEEGIADLSSSIAIARTGNALRAGYTGRGVKVAVYEFSPTSFNGLRIAGRFTTRPPTRQAHTQLVAAVIKNRQRGGPYGHAAGCQLYLANRTSSAALTWATQQGCSVINQSFHFSSEQQSDDLSASDHLKDYLALLWPYPTIVQAAGNVKRGDPRNEVVNHKGYNSISVANHDDSAGSIASSSTRRNPWPGAGRELPEIAANGTGVSAVGLTMSGTSFASPAVAGVAAILHQVNAVARVQPVLTRALLLAGARRNPSGSTWWNDVAAGVDAADGAGALDATTSVNIALSPRRRPGRRAYRRGWDVGAWDPRRSTAPVRHRIVVPRDDTARHLRAVLAWSSTVSVSPSGTDPAPLSRFDLDLDLVLFDSRRRVVAVSASFNNVYEVLDFRAAPGAIYNLEVHYGAGLGRTVYGLAWTVFSDP